MVSPGYGQGERVEIVNWLTPPQNADYTYAPYIIACVIFEASLSINPFTLAPCAPYRGTGGLHSRLGRSATLSVFMPG